MKVKDTKAQLYAYDGDDVTMDFSFRLTSSSPNLERYYLGALTIDTKFAQISPDGKALYYIPDALGSTHLMLDDSARTKHRYLYTAWGELGPRTRHWRLNRYEFTQREYEPESNLIYYRARHYDPRLGRFIQKDPFVGRKPRFHYKYLMNQPTIFVDPKGFQRQMFDVRDASISPVGLMNAWKATLRDRHAKLWGKEFAAQAPWMNLIAHLRDDEIPTIRADYKLYRAAGGEPILVIESGLYTSRERREAAQFSGEILSDAITLGISFWEPADWALTAEEAITKGPRWTHLIGLLPIIPGAIVRKTDEMIDAASKGGIKRGDLLSKKIERARNAKYAAIDQRHIDALKLEQAGGVIPKPRGGIYNHTQQVHNAIRSQKNALAEIKRALGEAKNPNTRRYLQKELSRISKLLNELKRYGIAER